MSPLLDEYSNQYSSLKNAITTRRQLIVSATQRGTPIRGEVHILLQEFRGLRGIEDPEMVKKIEALGEMVAQLRKSGTTSFQPIEDIEEVSDL